MGLDTPLRGYSTSMERRKSEAVAPGMLRGGRWQSRHVMLIE
ncbi:hypothetical protein [Rathayibacter festucae]|nr:hypothetical protein [Rathayibacter festucae]